MKYKIVDAPSRSELEKKIGEYIEKGWKPTGGLCVDNVAYYQAIIWEEGYWGDITKQNI